MQVKSCVSTAWFDDEDACGLECKTLSNIGHISLSINVFADPSYVNVATDNLKIRSELNQWIFPTEAVDMCGNAREGIHFAGEVE